MSAAGIKPWVEVVSLHPDVISENFSEDIFALDLGPLADHELRGMNVADDASENLHGAGTDDVAGDQHAMAKDRDDLLAGCRALDLGLARGLLGDFRIALAF